MKTVKTFYKEDIQEAVDELQGHLDPSDLMKVVVNDDFELQDDGTFREKVNGEALFQASSSLTQDAMLLKELATALIDLSL